MGDSQYNEEDQWSQATLAPANLSQARSIAGRESGETSQSPDPGLLPALLTVLPNMDDIKTRFFEPDELTFEVDRV